MTSDPLPRPAGDDLAARLQLVQEVMARTPDLLQTPLRLDFRPFPAERHLDAWRSFAAQARTGRLYGGLVLYVHVPFCAHLCSYCLLSSLPTPGRRPQDDYVEALRAEIALYKGVLEDVPVSTLHFGGGTPSLLSAVQLDALLSDLAGFARAPEFSIGFEAHPNSATTPKLEVLAKHGVGRISFGVETFTPAVLAAVGRAEQTAERVATAVDGARRAGLKVNLDLLAGLPGETAASFVDSVRQALALAPSSLSVNRYIAESSPLAGLGFVPNAAANAAADAMLLAADQTLRELRPPALPREPLAVAAYGTQYVWSDERAYFQQDMIGPASVLAFGHGGLGHLHAGSFYTAAGTPDDYVAALRDGRPPEVLVTPLSRRWEMASFVADGACRGGYDASAFATVFGRDPEAVFGPELTFLRERGWLRGRAKPAARDFTVGHLLAFLLLEHDELRRRAQELGSTATPHPARRRSRGRVAIESTALTSLGPQPTDVIDAGTPTPDQLLARLTELRRDGELSLWTESPAWLSPELRDRAAVAGVTELVWCGPLADAQTLLQTAVPPVALYIDLETTAPEAIAAAGATAVLLDVPAHGDPERAAALRTALAAPGLRVELLAAAPTALAQYAAVGSELPPSLLWCRIAMRAADTARRSLPRPVPRLW